jgi:twitching motility two-component system response regulator PilH
MKTKILVVDDSRTQRQLFSEIFEANGIAVVVASDGVEALETLESIHPDIVLLDIVMPRMNGYEVCRKIKSNPNTQNVPVVLCSAKSEEFDRYWGLKQGADAYISKPCQNQDLISTIRTLLEG